MANDRRIGWRVLDVAVNDAYESNAVELDVHHTKGGANYFSGGYTKAGFWFSVMPVKVRDGFTSFVIGASKGRQFFMAEVPRFNAKKLEQLATAIKPHTAAIVAAMLAGDYETIKGFVTTAANPPAAVTVTRTRKALGTLLREAHETNGIPVTIHVEADGRQMYEIDGVRYTPGDAALRLGVGRRTANGDVVWTSECNEAV